MKSLSSIVAATLLLASCGGGSGDEKAADQLAKLKKQRLELDAKIKKLETETASKNPQKASPVSVTEVQPAHFRSYIEVQSQIVGDENVLATPQAAGVITHINVKSGQKVSKGQVLATMDAAAIEQQIKGVDVKLTLSKSLYEKQKGLWDQQIGSEVQLLQAKATYEGATKEKEALLAQRNMYRIVAPISGTVDDFTLKVGDMASPGQVGIRVVSFDKLRAEANLGENYIGKVKAGDKVILVFPDIQDSITTKLGYVARQVDPISRAFTVQVHLSGQSKVYPNMSCRMKISNYENDNALVIPVQVIQHTAEGDMVYVADGNKAKAVIVTVGRNSNGMVEILKGLKAGDRVITEGFEDVDNGESIVVE
ncbi:MAG: efflux RND transporter periplasmic adaptor subunit [Chitinophagaceae bacterium]